MIDYKSLSDSTFNTQFQYECWLDKQKYQEKTLHLTEAFEAFKEELYSVCMDKIRLNEQAEHFKDVLWRFKKWRSNPIDKERAKAFPLLGLMARYGLKVRQSFIRCPFHEGDKGASLKLYPNNTWHCFGCHAGNDTIDFVMKYQKVDFITAVKSLL